VKLWREVQSHFPTSTSLYRGKINALFLRGENQFCKSHCFDHQPPQVLAQKALYGKL
jgi:hypothetical protein